MFRNFEELNFDFIQWSNRDYRLTFRRLPPNLLMSVREVGVLNPLIVTESDDPDRHAIVTGWLRFEAARQVGKNSVPAHIYRSFPPKIMLLCGLFDNIGHRTMNPVEHALTLRKLSDFYTRDEIVANFLPLLGFRPVAENWDRLAAVLELPEEMQWAVADGELNEHAARTLMRLPAADREPVYRLMRALRLNARAQLEVAEQFFQIWERDDTTPGEIISEENWDRFIADETDEDDLELPQELEEFFTVEDQPQSAHEFEGHNLLEPGAAPGLTHINTAALKAPFGFAELTGAGDARIGEEAEQVRKRLQMRRFPHLAQIEQEYAATLNELRLPPEARIVPAAYFESKTQRLEVRFNSSAQLRNVLEEILDAEERGLFQRLLASISGA